MNTMAVRSGRGVGVRRLPDHEPHDSGCADLFDTEIAPGLAGLEERRLALKQSVLLRSTAPALALIASLAGLYWTTTPACPDWAMFAVVSGFLASVCLAVFAYVPAGQFEHKSRDLIMGPVGSFLGNLTHQHRAGFDVSRFASCGIVGHFTSAKVEEEFAGEYHGTNFEMAQVSLSRRTGYVGNRRAHTVFRGLLIALELPHSDQGGKLIGRDLDKVGIIDIASAHDESAVRAGIVDKQLFLALPMRRDFFATGSLFRSVYGCEQNIREMLQQIAIVHRVIDAVNGARPSRLT
jgi:hypothetical protein